MKIGLISINMYTKGLNYACPVHTFAFQQFLLSHGIESVVLDYKPNYYGKFNGRYPGRYYRNLVEWKEGALADGKLLDDEALRRLARNRGKAQGFSALERERAQRYDRFWDFIDTYYVKTDKTYDSDSLEFEDPDFDCYICVTDVIWKYQDVEGFDRGYFLGSTAMEGKWKIAYSASRGVPKEFDEEQSRLFFHYIDDIDFISVRERSLKELVESGSSKSAELVVDPVLLNDAALYEKVAVKPEEENYVLVYYAEECTSNTLAKAVEYARKRGLKIIETTNLPIPGGAIDAEEGVESIFRYDIGPAEWLGYIQHADCVFTNSFHGTCFSILFEKEFYVGSRHGDKIANLLKTLQLENRMLDKSASAPLPACDPIDYGLVKRLLGEATESSARFILEAIKSIEGKKKPVRDYDEWKRKQRYPIQYKCKSSKGIMVDVCNQRNSAVSIDESGTLLFSPADPVVNDGRTDFHELPFFAPGRELQGWKVRFKVDNRFFLCLDDGSYVSVGEYRKENHGPVRVFDAAAKIPFIPVDSIKMMVVEPVWAKAGVSSDSAMRVILNSGADRCSINRKFLDRMGVEETAVKHLESGSIEFELPEAVFNDGSFICPPSPFERSGPLFKGWRVRVKCAGIWYWILADGSFLKKTPEGGGKNDRAKIFVSGARLPIIPSSQTEMVVLEAVWRKAAKVSLFKKVKDRRIGEVMLKMAENRP